MDDPLNVAVPCAGWLDRAYVKLSPSRSIPLSVIDSATSSFAVIDWAVAEGASLTAFTVIDTVAAGDVTVPSETVKVKLSGPL